MHRRFEERALRTGERRADLIDRRLERGIETDAQRLAHRGPSKALAGRDDTHERSEAAMRCGRSLRLLATSIPIVRRFDRQSSGPAS